MLLLQMRKHREISEKAESARKQSMKAAGVRSGETESDELPEDMRREAEEDDGWGDSKNSNSRPGSKPGSKYSSPSLPPIKSPQKTRKR